MDSSQLLVFFKFCNEHLTNLNEYQIAQALISHIRDIESVTQEDIARQANISVASVSRFIHRAGFTSFQDFKHKIEIFNHDLRMHRILDHTLRFMRYSVQDMTAELYQDACTHLQETYENLDLEKLKTDCITFKASKQLFFWEMTMNYRIFIPFRSIVLPMVFPHIWSVYGKPRM